MDEDEDEPVMECIHNAAKEAYRVISKLGDMDCARMAIVLLLANEMHDSDEVSFSAHWVSKRKPRDSVN